MFKANRIQRLNGASSSCLPGVSGLVYEKEAAIQFTQIIYSWIRLTGCDLSYGPENTGNTTILENFLPPYRTFKVLLS